MILSLLIPFRPFQSIPIIPAHTYLSVTISSIPYHPARPFHSFNSFPLPIVTHPLKFFPIPSYISHPFPSLTLRNFFPILARSFPSFRAHFIPSIPSRPFHPFLFCPCHPFPSHPVPSRSRSSGSEDYEAQSGQVGCVFCRRGRWRLTTCGRWRYLSG